MTLPLILVCGPAGSGKDTVAAMIAKQTDAMLIAQADPMKRFAQKVFGFTEQQLWGPSEYRNGEDARFNETHEWGFAYYALRQKGVHELADVIPMSKDRRVLLEKWFLQMAHVHGFEYNWTTREFYVKAEVKGLSPRYALQTLGTEWGRKILPEMWNEYAVNNAFKALEGQYNHYEKAHGFGDVDYSVVHSGKAPPPSMVVITDGRFRNEILNVRRQGGFALLVKGPQQETLTAGVAGHVSEKELGGIPDNFFNHILVNDKTKGLDHLKDLVNDLMFHWF